MNIRAIAIVVALVMIIGLIAERTWPRGREQTVPPAPASGERAGSAASRRGHVQRIASPAERQRIADRIAASRAASRASSSGGAATSARTPPSLPATPPADGELARASVPLRDALSEAIPLLADCYTPEPRAQQTATVRMTLVGDQHGTLIDADELVDDTGAALAPALDDCLRATLRGMQLPPLAEGSDLKIQYSFRFDD